jgi:hypothetical protein
MSEDGKGLPHTHPVLYLPKQKMGLSGCIKELIAWRLSGCKKEEIEG